MTLSEEDARSGVGVLIRLAEGRADGGCALSGPKAFWKVFLDVGEATERVSIRSAVLLFPRDLGS